MTNINNQLGLTRKQIEQMFDAQRTFNEMVISEYKDIHNWDKKLRNMWLHRQCTALMVERTELLDSTPWKWWMKKEEDIQNSKVEVIDMFHFLISMYQIKYTSNSIEHFIVDTENKESAIHDFYFEEVEKTESEEVKDVYANYLEFMQNYYNNLKCIANDWIKICIQYELTGDILFDTYFKKMEVNIQRQKQKLGYNAETKDPNDCKHI